MFENLWTIEIDKLRAQIETLLAEITEQEKTIRKLTRENTELTNRIFDCFVKFSA